MIKPTVGRVVWYHPEASSEHAGKTLAAHVCHVWSDSCVNLMVIDPNGNPFSRTSVYLMDEGSEHPASQYAEWMPYQKGQAAKTEALEAQADSKSAER